MPTLTITTTAQQAQRVATAFGQRLGLKDGGGNPRDATPSEVKDFVIVQIRLVVQQQEQHTAQMLITDTQFDPT